MASILRFVTDSRYSAYFFALALATLYCAIPLAALASLEPNPYFLSLASMAGVSAVMVVAGFHVPGLERLVNQRRLRIPVSEFWFQVSVWGAFGCFLAVTFATADVIPLISALSGGFTPEELDLQRGAFLKTRPGWEAGLSYVSAVFVGTLLPYSLSRLFVRGPSLAGFGAVGLFLAYSISFLQKSLFIQVVAPLAYLTVRKTHYAALVIILVGSAALVYANTILARGIEQPAPINLQIEQLDSAGDSQTALVPADAFNAGFRPASTAQYMAWRIFAVPVFTAADAIRTLDVKFSGRHLYGATSSLVAATLGLDRVNFDAEVYALQWGATDIGRANSVYITDGYVNFGWLGVVVFSLFVGMAFRVFSSSSDEAMKSMWPLFAFNVIQASLIGTLLSAGFALLFFVALFVRIVPRGPFDAN